MNGQLVARGGLPEQWGPAAIESPIGRASIGGVDAVALEARAAALATRSIKRETKARLLRLAIACMDLTTLEGADTEARVEALCRKAARPDVEHPEVPAVAAVCVYPVLVAAARRALAGSEVKVAAVAGGFPATRTPLDLRLREIAYAVAEGADEIDITLNRDAFLAGRLSEAAAEITAAREACEGALLKVILETGELGSYDAIRRASILAIGAGADMVKTSTGKIPAAATLPVGLCIMEAIRDYRDATGHAVGLKISGGVRTAKDAWRYLVVVNETLGPEWLRPDRFRFGASSLLNDVLLQLRKLESGRYESPDYLSLGS